MRKVKGDKESKREDMMEYGEEPGEKMKKRAAPKKVVKKKTAKKY